MKNAFCRVINHGLAKTHLLTCVTKVVLGIYGFWIEILIKLYIFWITINLLYYLIHPDKVSSILKQGLILIQVYLNMLPKK